MTFDTKKSKAGWILKDGRNIVDVLATKTASLVSNKSEKKTPYILSTIRYDLTLL